MLKLEPIWYEGIAKGLAIARVEDYCNLWEIKERLRLKLLLALVGVVVVAAFACTVLNGVLSDASEGIQPNLREGSKVRREVPEVLRAKAAGR